MTVGEREEGEKVNLPKEGIEPGTSA